MSISQRRKGSVIKRMGVHILLASSMLSSSPKPGFPRENGMLTEIQSSQWLELSSLETAKHNKHKNLPVSRVLSFYPATPPKKSNDSSL
jgi:hypothetical protein